MSYDNDGLRAAELAITALSGAKDTIHTIRTALREQAPDAFQALEEAERDLPRLQEDAKKACRLLGPGTHMIEGHAVQVKTAATSTAVDTEGLIERAIELGETESLLEMGVLKYEVVAHQIARLPAKQRVRYEQFLTVKTGTHAVQLPAELK